MKNKKVIYILLPLTLFVWGLIVYRIFFNQSKEENSFIPPIANVKKTTQVKVDTFTLLLNYQDPFLKQARRKVNYSDDENKPAVRPSALPKVEPQEEKTIVWPSLKYEGFVRHISKDKALIIVGINGKSTLMQTGETINNIKLVQVYNDSITVNYEKQNKTIKKK